MDIGLFGKGTASLSPNLLAVEEDRMHDGRGNSSERKAVGDSEGSREQQRRVCFVFLNIEGGVVGEDTANLVRLAGVVEGGTR